jgi:hypothetical protein
MPYEGGFYVLWYDKQNNVSLDLYNNKNIRGETMIKILRIYDKCIDEGAEKIVLDVDLRKGDYEINSIHLWIENGTIVRLLPTKDDFVIDYRFNTREKIIIREYLKHEHGYDVEVS